MFNLRNKIFKVIKKKTPNTFLAMHGNVECCVFAINDSFTEILKCEIFNKKHTPVEIKDCNSLLKWINKRLIPANRIQYDRIVSNYLNVYDNLTKLILDSYGLSLSDGYWIKPYEDGNTWETINYYKNDFDLTLLDMYLDSTVSSEYKPIAKSPSNNIDGISPKAWTIENNDRILIKRGKADVYNEVTVSKILDEFGFSHAAYWFDLYNEKPVCKCKNFTSDEVEFIPASEIARIYNNKKEDILWYMNFIDTKVKEGYNKISNMLLIDFVLGNEDRHWGNFGILRNINTLEFVDTAPIFDNGNALWISGFFNPVVKSKTTLGYNYNLKDLINKGYYSSKWEKALEIILSKEAKFETKEEIEKQYNGAVKNLKYIFN